MNRNLTRIICFVLAAIMLISLLPAVFAYSGTADWAEEKVAAMDELGLIPDSLADADMSQNISRLDMARIAVLAAEKLLGAELPLPEDHPFSDTTDPAAEKAFAAGLVAGDGDGTFRPDDTLIRLEFFSFAASWVKKQNYPVTEADHADLSRFSDAASIPWGLENTRLVVGLGIAAGTGTKLEWDANTTRQEALCMFYQAYTLVEAEQPEAPTEPSEPSEPSQPTEPSAPTEPTEPVKPDFIGLDDWARDKVEALDELGLIPDEVRAAPMNGIITRQNMCKVIMRAYKQLKNKTDADLGEVGESPFSDTSDPDVIRAHKLGIVNGTGDGKFSPDSPISRQDFFTVSVSFLKAMGYNYADDPAVDLHKLFTDADQIASYAQPATRLLVSIGGLRGSNGQIKPRDSIVSQEALCLFYQLHSFLSTWIGNGRPDTPPDYAGLRGQAVVDKAMEYLGYPYAYGGKTPEEGFDCSGFVYYVYQQFGYDLKPGATNQWKSLPDVLIPREELKPGDLVFFSDDGTVGGMSHVGIYCGKGEMIHAANPDSGVVITSLSTDYYDSRYLGAKRVLN